jgi:hypothetical protein
MLVAPPEPDEAAEYYQGYIAQAGEGDILALLKSQSATAVAFLRGISEERSLYRYAPDKWSICQVLNHVNDSERVFAYRALWFARGFDSPLPSFDQDIAVLGGDAEARPWASHIEELAAIRASTLTLFQNLPTEAWMRRGIASGYSFSVRAIAYIIVGHANHHLRVLRERYSERESPQRPNAESLRR